MSNEGADPAERAPQLVDETVPTRHQLEEVFMAFERAIKSTFYNEVSEWSTTPDKAHESTDQAFVNRPALVCRSELWSFISSSLKKLCRRDFTPE